MARNPNVIKMRRQRFRKRRGAFAPGSAPSTLDNKFADPKLQKFWAERITPRGMTVSRAQIPEKYEGICDYRHRGNTSGEPTWLDTLFPGIQMQSPQRKAALELRLQTMQEDGTTPFSCVVVSRTRNSKLFLYHTEKKDCWYFQETLHDAIRRSITYGTKERALAVLALQQVRWLKPQPETLGSLLNGAIPDSNSS